MSNDNFYCDNCSSRLGNNTDGLQTGYTLFQKGIACTFIRLRVCDDCKGGEYHKSLIVLGFSPVKYHAADPPRPGIQKKVERARQKLRKK